MGGAAAAAPQGPLEGSVSCEPLTGLQGSTAARPLEGDVSKAASDGEALGCDATVGADQGSFAGAPHGSVDGTSCVTGDQGSILAAVRAGGLG